MTDPNLAQQHEREVAAGDRFEFGANWTRFLTVLNDARIEEAVKSLRAMLGRDSLEGLRFLDAGSGSGLFSLAARKLGAAVHSFDYDAQSVACTTELRRRYFEGDPAWTVERGSVLDRDYLAGLGQFDIVYSWGVLHHTGAMWQALGNVAPLVKEGGSLFVSIYNDQGMASRNWGRVKKLYNRLPAGLRGVVLIPSLVKIWGPVWILDFARSGNPMRTWRSYGDQRGMSPWWDLVDWVGGWPFEVAKPEAIFDFYRARGFTLTRLKTCAGKLGCNEYVFERNL